MKDSYLFYKDQLGREYRVVFDQVEMYLLTQKIDEASREDRLGELLDIFLSAEKAGKPVTSITGKNLEQFCKAFCSDFGVKNRILSFLDQMKSIAWILIVISILDIFFFFSETEGMDIRSAVSSLNISGYGFGILAAWLLNVMINTVVRHILFRTKRVSMKILKAVSIVGGILGFVLIYLSLSLDSTDLFDCPLWIILLVSGVYLLVYYVTNGQRIKRQKVKFSDLVGAEMENSFAETMEKKFVKAKKKHLKKGKGELTLETFLEKEEKSCKREEKMKIYYYSLPIIITVSMYLGIVFGEGFETPFDSFIFIIIMLVIEYPLMIGLWKISKKGIVERRAWMRKKREEMEKGEEPVGRPQEEVD